MQGEIEVVERNVELHAHFFAHGLRADDINAEWGMKQCAQLGARKIVRRMRQDHLQAGAGRGERNDIVALGRDRRHAERLRFEAGD